MLRAGGFEVGPFYRVSKDQLFRVDDQLEVPEGALPVGPYAPDDGVLLPVAEGAVLSVVDSVEGLYRLAFHFGETLEGIARLPGVARELYANAPVLWDAFHHKPYAERVRTLSRLTTGALGVLGTSGAGMTRAASWGGKLGQLSIPFLFLADEGTLALRLVAIPVGGAVAASGRPWAPRTCCTWPPPRARARAVLRRPSPGPGGGCPRTRACPTRPGAIRPR